MKQVFPKEILENTSEVYLFKHRVKSVWFLGVLLFIMILGICLLPLLKVDVYSSAKGVIRSDISKEDIYIIVSAKVLQSNLQNNRRVYMGDTLLVLDSKFLQERDFLLKQELEIISVLKMDLEALLSKEKIDSQGIASSKYQKLTSIFLEKRRSGFLEKEKAETELKRQKHLFLKGVISEKEYLEAKYVYETVLSKSRQEINEFRESCEKDLETQNYRLRQVKMDRNKTKEQIKKHYVTASANGTLNKVIAVSPGNYVTSGTRIAEISPENSLIVECFVSPLDIGLLRDNMITQFQVDAFNYNQWGTISGRVSEIGRDLQFNGTTPFFSVKCKMFKNTLTLKNGFKGILKKGMTVTVHFVLSKRSLWELLFDQLEDWLYPSSQDYKLPNF